MAGVLYRLHGSCKAPHACMDAHALFSSGSRAHSTFRKQCMRAQDDALSKS